MAKQKSMIKLQGSIDDMTFYQRNGKNFVKKKIEGPTKEKIKTDPRFKRTLENNQEFGGAASAAMALKQGFLGVQKLVDKDCHARFLKVCREIISLSPGIRGQRPFKPEEHKDYFLRLTLQKQTSFSSIFIAPYSVESTAERNTATIIVPDFNTSNLLNPPSGATHFKILNHISVLTKYEYNSTIQKYESSYPDLDSKNAIAETDYLPLGSMVGASTTLTATLPEILELPVPSILLACLGVRFYQKVTGGGYYEFASNDAMKVINVY